ncbi:MAG: gamma-glutamyl-gamma-aminobutyrate hydrolase family protein [Rickettsiaceae bacterium H1]|nr:gamma-glutamyl-gamma-aminobutyrate hydrolase family protein [Rickettsiaceae bacterium H1]
MKHILLFFLVSFFFGSSYAADSIVGLLRTQQETYPHELDFSDDITEMLENLGAKSVLIDYNAIVKKEGNLETKIRQFIQDNYIKRVIIPGNYYNLDSEPFAPNTNRQDVTEVLVKMANEQKIYLIGICGGLQGVMHAKGIEIVKIGAIRGNGKQHLISNPDPHVKNVPLHEVRVNPASRLATVIKDHSNVDQNGWITLYLPDAHSRVVNNSVENIAKLNGLGYKIVGFSGDGMIEIIEDKFGNIYFQDHPEGLLISREKNNNNKISSLRDASTGAIMSMFKDFINR